MELGNNIGGEKVITPFYINVKRVVFERKTSSLVMDDVENRYNVSKIVGEQCIGDDELRDLLAKKAAHIAQLHRRDLNDSFRSIE
ncbi:hypothetical protein YC2023_059269 [Brassica napus]